MDYHHPAASTAEARGAFDGDYTIGELSVLLVLAAKIHQSSAGTSMENSSSLRS